MRDGLIVLAKAHHFGELARDPLLTVACVLLAVVSVGWVVITRLISRNLRRAMWLHEQAQRAPLAEVRPPRDIWSRPP